MKLVVIYLGYKEIVTDVNFFSSTFDLHPTPAPGRVNFFLPRAMDPQLPEPTIPALLSPSLRNKKDRRLA